MEMEGLLKDLAHLNKMLFVVGGKASLAKCTPTAKRSPDFMNSGV